MLDTEFCVRCALAGISPTCIDEEIAVRYLQPNAKSASPGRFVAEWDRVSRKLEREHVGRIDLVRDVWYRVGLKARHKIARSVSHS